MSYNRKKTREVSLGNIKIGGDNPIAVQSMTTTDTRDAAKTIEQIKKLEEAKRLLATTTYSMKEIAVKLKYKSHTHFGMDFKNNTGMTPAEYRKAIKAKREKQMNTKDYQMNLKDYLAKMC